MNDRVTKITKSVTRRSLIAAAGGAVAMGVLGRGAFADPIQDVLKQRATEWSDGFDAAVVSAPEVRTNVPIMSPDIVAAVENAILQYSDIVARGGWPVVPAEQGLRVGARGPAVTALRQRLIISGDLSVANGVSDAFDTYVDAAVKRFQARHGIPADGIVGNTTFAAINVPAAVRLNQLATNLTRLQMITKKVPDRFVMVNIPAAQIEAVENGYVAQRHTAIVGKVDRPSPIVNSKITQINFHPYWTVPASIIRKDLIPIMQKKPNYLTDYRIRIYDRSGNELNPAQVDWFSDEATNYMFRQDPSDENSLGLVKINFPSPDGVYMHDTPHKGLFNEEARFDSSGCVRVQGIRELIVWLLRDTPGQSREQIDEQFRNYQRLDVQVTNPVPLFWTYLTAWAMSDGVVHFRNDIYGLDGLELYAQTNTTPL
ncbi:L,D-transpeptidase family protein [Bauldia litoralis]|uniref:Murein L,D-transpeptidase YcbB/YkuD n=1 Tax=Bauldia litoralis TaxID=665467 RepID=A0A1G6B1W0_9HYPH|nr:L,D-transpeptidase family protein [Bauldia litoralis]SDB14647.1 Murein L,D-transpeptidase YcbB/YkuD [Bauldia litoralis]